MIYKKELSEPPITDLIMYAIEGNNQRLFLGDEVKKIAISYGILGALLMKIISK